MSPTTMRALRKMTPGRGLQMESPFGRITWRAIDHQSTMGAYLGKTKLEGTKGVMTDYIYIDGAKVLPSDDEVKKLRAID